MGTPIVNRNYDEYSSGMETTIMELDTSILPAHWRHMDDDSLCERHEVCPRDTYVRGGRPEHPDTLGV